MTKHQKLQQQAINANANILRTITEAQGSVEEKDLRGVQLCLQAIDLHEGFFNFALTVIGDCYCDTCMDAKDEHETLTDKIAEIRESFKALTEERKLARAAKK